MANRTRWWGFTGLGGAAFLACRTGAPIVPVGLGGTEAAMPKGSKFVHPVRMTIVIGEPLVPPPSDGRTSRKAIKALTAELADRIQVLFDEAQDLAGRPNAQRFDQPVGPIG